MVFSTVLSEDSVEWFRELMSETEEMDEEFEALPPDAPGGERNAKQTIAEAVAQLYNPAQLRVLKRANEPLAEAAANDGAPDGTVGSALSSSCGVNPG